MRKRIDLEYLFSSSLNVLFSRLSTATGLMEWFADDVIHKGKQFTFVWEGVEERASMTDVKKNSYVQFQWEDADDPEEFLRFSIDVEPLTGDIALIVTDFTDHDEEDDAVELWNKQIDMLRRIIGA